MGVAAGAFAKLAAARLLCVAKDPRLFDRALRML